MTDDKEGKPSAKSPKERWGAMAARRKELGLKRVSNLWAHPDDHEGIKEDAAKRTAKRFGLPVAKRAKKPKPPKA